MKLSTLTTDFQIILDYLEENQQNYPSVYDEILSQLENNGKDKDSIRLFTITRLVLDYFPTDENFQKLFDYTPDELASILNAILTDRDSYIKIWNKINEITDLTAFEYSFPDDTDEVNYGNEYISPTYGRYGYNKPVILDENETSVDCIDDGGIEFTAYFLDGEFTHAYTIQNEAHSLGVFGENGSYDVPDDFIVFLTNLISNIEINSDDVPTAVWVDDEITEGMTSYELADIWEGNLFYFNEQNKIVEIFGVELANDMIADIYNWGDLSNDKKEKVYDYLTANPELVEELANKGNVVTQQQAIQQQIEEDEDEVVETKKKYTDAQIAKSMNITLEQLFTLRVMKPGATFTFKKPYKYYNRKTKKYLESKKGTFNHFSELFDKGYVSYNKVGGVYTSMKAKEFFNKTSAKVVSYEGPATDLSLVEPTEADLNKIRKFGKMVY